MASLPPNRNAVSNHHGVAGRRHGSKRWAVADRRKKRRNAVFFPTIRNNRYEIASNNDINRIH